MGGRWGGEVVVVVEAGDGRGGGVEWSGVGRVEWDGEWDGRGGVRKRFRGLEVHRRTEPEWEVAR